MRKYTHLHIIGNVLDAVAAATPPGIMHKMWSSIGHNVNINVHYLERVVMKDISNEQTKQER